jgi:hypothetical protein
MLFSVGLGPRGTNVTPALRVRLPSRLVAGARLTAVCARWVYGLGESGAMHEVTQSPQSGSRNFDLLASDSGGARHAVGGVTCDVA